MDLPEPYSGGWLELPVGYVRRVAEVLGERVVAWWDDPWDPRDATIRLTGGWALVWDEESGWRRGRFVSGVKGMRTELAEVRYLGGGVLPAPERVAGGPYRGRARPIYRSYADFGDGLDVQLFTHACAGAGSR